MEIHIVHNTSGGFSQEDSCQSHIIGVYENLQLAQQVAMVSGARVQTLEINTIPPKTLSYLLKTGFKITS